MYQTGKSEPSWDLLLLGRWLRDCGLSVTISRRAWVFRDAARIAFGAGKNCVAVSEVRVLEVTVGPKKKKIGKVDFLLVEIEDGEAVDFAALEIQSVYMSGETIRPVFNHYLESGDLLENGRRRTDFRSSGPKRLMPQLALKVPIFRLWGKRFL